MIQSKIVTIISLCTLSLSILCTNPIKAEALTQKNAKEMISGIRPLEGEIRNPDISLSDDELNAKYEGRIYREIEKNYVKKSFVQARICRKREPILRNPDVCLLRCIKPAQVR